MEPPAGDRVPGPEPDALAARVHDRDRSLHLVAGPGAVVQDRGNEDPRAPPQGRGGARHEVRRAALPRYPAGQRNSAASSAGTDDRRIHRGRAETDLIRHSILSTTCLEGPGKRVQEV